ncbi:uncharacterized protein RHOBADRAFT_45103 [Rhodotorula graminis WP1]|uniref:HIT domain-containing protein n=1 Tax=Rhodotorula graminis (strain WP1) TaxID=578459 RepID=A0A0P9FDI4_RHOGW|nr:uncharacterized protein RHOBADRAFT_45103 [Rhodotorula graminis WP1]KPV73812.1 hypothetical protein RHOBADRAFT_45103 [Rhodotorula graminis WP1]
MAALDSERRPRPHHRKRETLTRRISFPTFHLSPDQLALVRRWIISFALVDFDVDTGPNLDNAYPPARLPASTRANVAFSSMPEAVGLPHPEQLPDGGYAYHWRVPYAGEDELARLDLEVVDDGEDEDEARLLRLPEGEGADGALHGFVWFVRDKDERLRRGYSQRSLVLISHLPALSGLFSALVSILGPLHFKHAQPGGARGGMVETACHNIASWPDPTPGATLELPFLGSVLTVSIPLPSQAQFPLPASASSSKGNSPSSAPLRRTPSAAPALPPTPAAWHLSRGATHLPLLTGPPSILPASLPSTPLCLLLFPPASSSSPTSSGHGEIGPVGYSKLLLLWELVALGEPLLVWAAEPRVGAEVVEALKALIKPIPFAGDVRPYFHVHDVEFANLCKAGKKPPQGLLVASTNPLLLSTCKHWPHVLRLDRAAPAPSSTSPSSSPTLSLPLSAASSSPSGIAPLRQRSASNGNGSQHGGGGDDGSTGGGGGAGKEFGLRTTSKRHVKKDEAVEKEIAELWRRGDYLACDAVIYRHFAALTERFLAPLSRYFGTLWAGNEAVAARAPLVSPGPSPLPSTRFSRSAFLTSLRAHGSPLPLKSGAPSLSQPGSTATERFYSRFVDGANFERWAEKRVRDTGGEVRRRFVRTLESEDWELWARGRDVGEVDDMVRRLEREVVLLDPAPPTSSSSLARTSVSTTSSSTLPSSSSTPSSRTNSPAPSSTTSQAQSPTPTPAMLASSALIGEGPGAKLRAGVRVLQGLRDEKRRARDASVGSTTVEWMLGSLLSTCAPLFSRLRPSPSHDDLIVTPPRDSTKPAMGAAPAHGAPAKDCIFCGVTATSPGFRVVHEDGEFVVFKDRSPGSKVHLLAVPKRHVDSVKTLEVEDVSMLERMKHLGRRVLVEQGVPEGEQRLGFHIPPFFSVNHLHLHLLSLPLMANVIDILRAGQRVHVRPVKRDPPSPVSAVA